MKHLILSILLVGCFPTLHALDTTHLERKVAARLHDVKSFLLYSNSCAENGRQAIRLGYANFYTRFNTNKLTPTDLEIIEFVKKELAPFATSLQNQTKETMEKSDVAKHFQKQFMNLSEKLAKLLYKNQNRYTNPAFIDDKAALQEASNILTEALRTGNF